MSTTNACLLAPPRDFDEFYAEFGPRLLHMLENMHVPEPEDVFQHISIKVIEKDLIGQFDPAKGTRGDISFWQYISSIYANYASGIRWRRKIQASRLTYGRPGQRTFDIGSGGGASGEGIGWYSEDATTSIESFLMWRGEALTDPAFDFLSTTDMMSRIRWSLDTTESEYPLLDVFDCYMAHKLDAPGGGYVPQMAEDMGWKPGVVRKAVTALREALKAILDVEWGVTAEFVW